MVPKELTNQKQTVLEQIKATVNLSHAYLVWLDVHLPQSTR